LQQMVKFGVTNTRLMLRGNSTIGEMGLAAIMHKRTQGLRRGGDIGLLVAMLRYASLISRPMRDGVADLAGYSSNELRVLMALSDEGESAGHDLAELMGMQAMSVSRALASLQAMGLVEPVENSSNRRRKPYIVSARGAATYAAMKPNIAKVSRFLFGPLSARERARLGKLLANLNQQVLRWQPRERHPHVPRA
jgi:DNA-binding MarR family transcriptional regulator